MENENNYGVSSISIPSDMEAVRMRPGMYVGEMDNPRQLLSEALDNALDESQSGYSEVTEVVIDSYSRTYMVRDYGRGIPIGELELPNGSKEEVVKVLSTKLHSGAKFNNNAYRIRSGLHGVGLGCCNALSESFQIITRRDGKSVYFAAEKGEDKALIYSNTDQPNGCTVLVKGDPELFDSDIIPMDFIIDRCKISKAFGYPIKLYVDGKEIELDINSLHELIPLNSDESVYHKFLIKAQIDTGEFIHVAVEYTSETNSKFQGYTNLLRNKYGGTHVRLIERAIENIWQKYYGDAEVSLKPSDCKVGLRVLVAVFINDPDFSSQTKDKLTTKNRLIQPLIDAFSEKLEAELDNNEEIRTALLKRFSEYRISQNKLTAKKEIMELVKVNEVVSKTGGKVKRKAIVEGLADCTSSEVEGTEELIVEGRSAAGGAKRARDRRTQAVLPLRGKIKNTSYMKIEDALKSDDVRRIVNSNGAGVGEDCDPERCRYERINIVADADPDGKHIIALDLATFINIQPALVKAGKVYVIVPPLYGYKLNGKNVFTNDLDSIPDKIKKNKKFTRYKGLGEMDDDEFAESCLDRTNRITYQVQYPSDLDHFNRILGTTSGRKDLLKDLGLIKYIEDYSETEEEGTEYNE